MDECCKRMAYSSVNWVNRGAFWRIHRINTAGVAGQYRVGAQSRRSGIRSDASGWPLLT